MNSIKATMDELSEINDKYDLTNDPINDITESMNHAKVCTPVIGKFSAGKSALVNTILGYSTHILREDITPETSVPAEITYHPTEDSVQIVMKNGVIEKSSLNEISKMEPNADTVSHIHLELCAQSLEDLPDVMIVDMPGFDSGYDVHNRSIDDYLPQSLAYILTFPADDLILRSSIGAILKELCLNDMPICVVITKYDKRNEEEYDRQLAKLQESLRRYIGDRDYRICTASSLSGDAEQVHAFLAQIQEQAPQILARKFLSEALSQIDRTESYLKATLKSLSLSESQLEEEKSRLNDQLTTLSGRFTAERDAFSDQIAECVDAIAVEVEEALSAQESNLIAMAMTGQDLNSRINAVVRNAVTVGVRKHFIPKVDRYIRQVGNSIHGDDIETVHVNIHVDPREMSTAISTSVVAVTAMIVWGPVIGGIIAGITSLVNKLLGNKKREQVKAEVRAKLHSEVYPEVDQKVRSGLEQAIANQIDEINGTIEKEIAQQQETLEKALSDVQDKQIAETQSREERERMITEDLERLEAMRAEL